MKTWGTACVALLPLALAGTANATALSYFGVLAPDNPNAVFLVEFELAAAAALDIQTWGYGGSGGAPGGTSASGAVVLAGGFDPYVSLFSGTGAGAIFLASNDDGVCPVGTLSPWCADSTLHLATMPAGHYTLALTLPFNYSYAENLGSGTLGDGFIGLDTGFSDGACDGVCSNAFAFDIVSASLVPEPSSLPLVLVGGLAVWWRVRRRVPVGDPAVVPAATFTRKECP